MSRRMAKYTFEVRHSRRAIYVAKDRLTQPKMPYLVAEVQRKEQALAAAEGQEAWKFSWVEERRAGVFLPDWFAAFGSLLLVSF